jgi:hypothetical protein
MDRKTNKTRRKMTLTEHLAEREAKRQAKGQATTTSPMSAERIAELEALGTCDCPKCRAIRLTIKRRQAAEN